uniref:Ras-related protein Rab-7b n=1 Tax=Anolis carolinensis TaxID=28377 RepID=G1KM63_ANOCA|nr:PREDICTED: ras-related protein Rab-7a isoform X1 [Anolis carolinensis]|eukprot:XP_008102112.1 PREDICTED: ras-related protein Rab-7a isoform X1 [Anolis carolinensis]
MFRRSHLKILLIGNSGSRPESFGIQAGKSALMNQYVNNRFSSRYRATIGSDFLSKQVHIDGRMLTVQIWDTAGTERFQALGTALYRGSDCCLLVFDVTSASSFQALDKWHKQLLLQIEEQSAFPIAVIGNKTDLENREVSLEEAELWSRLHHATYFETSAKAATNVQEVFQWAVRAALKNRRISELPEPDSVRLETRPEGAHRDKCGC